MGHLAHFADPPLNRTAQKLIPVARPNVGKKEVAAVVDCLERGQLAGGPAVEEFERQIAAAHNMRHGVACNSGTTAITLALRGLGIGQGDKVLIPALTMVAVANAVLDVGAIPLFADSEPDTGNPYGKWLEIHGRVDAVIIPHLYGVIAEYFSWCASDISYPLKIIEDWAESHFAKRVPLSANDKAHAYTFSFYGNKIITTGEGGMVLVNDEETENRLRRLRAHAFSKECHFQHTEHAFGYRMTEMQGALGLAQLSRAAEFLAARTEIAEWYYHGLRRIQWLEFPLRPEGSVWWVFPLLVAKDSPVTREKVRAALAEKGVETRTYFYPLHRQAHLRRYATHDMPVADDLFTRGFYLPVWVGMIREDVEYICDTIRGLA